MKLLKKIFAFVCWHLAKQTEQAEQQIILFAIVMMVNFPLFGVLLKYEAFQPDEEFYLRVIATTLCVVLTTNNFWPKVLLKILPFFWYFTLLFCLPFLFSYLTLLNHGATLWLMNCMSAIFFLFLVTAFLDALILLFLGVGLAFCYHSYFSHNAVILSDNVSLYSLALTFSAAVIIGAFFARNQNSFNITWSKKFFKNPEDISKQKFMMEEFYNNIKEHSLNHAKKLHNFSTVELKEARTLESLVKTTQNSSSNTTHLINQEMNDNFFQREILSNLASSKNFSIFYIKTLLNNLFINNKETELFCKLKTVMDYQVWISQIQFDKLINNLCNIVKSNIKFIDKKFIIIYTVLGDEEDNFNYLYVEKTKYLLVPPSYPESLAIMQIAGGGIEYKINDNQSLLYIIKFPKID